MGFRLVPKSVTLNDLERRNGRLVCIISPNWVAFGVVPCVQSSDLIMASYGRHDLFVEYLSLQYSLYMSCFVCVLGGAFFLATALFIQSDRERTEKLIKGLLDQLLFWSADVIVWLTDFLQQTKRFDFGEPGVICSNLK